MFCCPALTCVSMFLVYCHLCVFASLGSVFQFFVSSSIYYSVTMLLPVFLLLVFPVLDFNLCRLFWIYLGLSDFVFTYTLSHIM